MTDIFCRQQRIYCQATHQLSWATSTDALFAATAYRYLLQATQFIVWLLTSCRGPHQPTLCLQQQLTDIFCRQHSLLSGYSPAVVGHINRRSVCSNSLQISSAGNTVYCQATHQLSWATSTDALFAATAYRYLLQATQFIVWLLTHCLPDQLTPDLLVTGYTCLL